MRYPIMTLIASWVQAPHFARSLEWLLFTALDASSGGQSQPSRLPARPVTSTAMAGTSPGQAAPAKPVQPLLQAAADLVRQFPQVSPI